ncbi:riboflavin-binding protein-like isoform X1 [Petromyzon marinus]|uniref:riboflavin-binding protein-like isoform X1 n=2 Tax=Petromyzon marinus TaxID=7757 RepID=UPI003F71ADE6
MAAMSPPWLCCLLLLLLCGLASAGSPAGAGGCMAGSKSKPRPGPEPGLQACSQYNQNACCTPESVRQLSQSPVVRVDELLWDRCGNLTPSCESFLKRVECYSRCSPLASRWAHRAHPSLLHHVPVCSHFCDSWFDACREDFTCVRNWIYDWDWSVEGNFCPGACVPFSQMFRDGRDLCEGFWGLALLPVAHGVEPCISPGDREGDITATATGAIVTSTVVESAAPPTRGNAASRDVARRAKRALFQEEVEGSGSGF